MVSKNINKYLHLVRLHKPIGILLLIWPTLWAIWLASAGRPDPLVLGVFILGAVLMRSAGCALNDFADYKFDAQVKRTRERPVAAGIVKRKTALLIFFILSLCAFMLVFLFNLLTICLAVIGVIFVALYPFLKRHTYLPQLGLGIAFAWGVPMAFAAVTNSVPVEAWFLFFTAALWPVAYDTMYAMADRKEDMKIGVKSTAILFGEKDTFAIAVLQVAFLLQMAWIGYLFGLGIYYYYFLLVAEGFFAYQQYLVKDGDPIRCYKAFVNNNWVGLAIFIGIVTSISP